VIPVGHRALVAVARGDDRYDCYYAHEGGHEWRLFAPLSAAVERTDADEGPGVDPRAVDGLDPAPLATGVSFETVVDTHLDFCTYEACYRVERDGVTPSFVGWFGFPAAERQRPGAGALVGVDPADPRADGALARGWFAGTKGALATGIDAGELTLAAARERFRTRLVEWAGDRTVVFGPEIEATAE